MHRSIRRHRTRLAFSGALVLAALGAVGYGAFALAGDDTATVPAGEEARLGGGPEQQAALSDGDVTSSEYEAAFQSTVDCIQAAGIPVSIQRENGQLRYTGGPFATKEELDAAKPTMEGCYIEHLRGIDVTRASTQ